MLALGRSRWEACWKTTSLERFPFGDFPLQVIVHSACQQLLLEPCKAPMQSQYGNFLSCGTTCKRSIQVLNYILKIKHTHTHTHTHNGLSHSRNQNRGWWGERGGHLVITTEKCCGSSPNHQEIGEERVGVQHQIVQVYCGSAWILGQ